MDRTTPIKIAVAVLFLLIVGILIYAGVTYKKPNIGSVQTPTAEDNLPATCVDEEPSLGEPVITRISQTDGQVGTTLTIEGCNFSGFEGDKDIWIENRQGIKGIIHGDPNSSTAKLIRFTLPPQACQQNTAYSGLPCSEWLDIVPGMYKIYTAPWGRTSNSATFTVTASGSSIEPPTESGQVFCTMDAKQCPDGSYVGRISPDCRFAECPGENTDIKPQLE